MQPSFVVATCTTEFFDEISKTIFVSNTKLYDKQPF